LANLVYLIFFFFQGTWNLWKYLKPYFPIKVWRSSAFSQNLFILNAKKTQMRLFFGSDEVIFKMACAFDRLTLILGSFCPFFWYLRRQDCQPSHCFTTDWFLFSRYQMILVVKWKFVVICFPSKDRNLL